MPARRLPTTDTRLRDQLRDYETRLQRIENGGVFKGRVSLGAQILLGSLQVAVVEVGDAKHLVFTNPTTGSTVTIEVP